MPTQPVKKHLRSLVDACRSLEVTDDALLAERALSTPALPAKAHRGQPSPGLAAMVFARDRYGCRYCGAKVVPPAVLKAAALVWPEALPYDAGWHPEATHPLFLASGAAVDLVDPASEDLEDADAYATACHGCSAQKGELGLKRLGWELRKPREDDWDGLVSSYEMLLLHRRTEAMSSGERSYHVRWLRAFGLDEAVVRGWTGRRVKAA